MLYTEISVNWLSVTGDKGKNVTKGNVSNLTNNAPAKLPKWPWVKTMTHPHVIRTCYVSLHIAVYRYHIVNLLVYDLNVYLFLVSQ